MDVCKKGDSGTQDDWGRGGGRSWDVLGWMVMERDMLTVQELPARYSQSRDAFLSPSLLGCLSPFLVPSPKWSWLESSVWGGAWRISSLWVGFCPNYSFSFCMTFAVSCGESLCPFSAFQVRCRISAALQLLLWAAPFVSAWPPALLWCARTQALHAWSSGAGGRCAQVGWPRWLGCECGHWERRLQNLLWGVALGGKCLIGMYEPLQAVLKSCFCWKVNIPNAAVLVAFPGFSF